MTVTEAKTGGGRTGVNWWRAACFVLLAWQAASFYGRMTAPGYKTKPSYIIQDGGQPFVVNGSLIEYFHYGPVDGQPLLLMGGAAQTGRVWSMFEDVFRRHNVRAICPTLPGYGLTDNNLQPVWPDIMSQLMSSLGFETFALAGISNGGFQAAYLASKYPQRVTALATFSPGIRPAGVDITPRANAFERLMVNLILTVPGYSILAPIMQDGLRYEPAEFLRAQNGPDVNAIANETVADFIFHDFRRAVARTGLGIYETAVLVLINDVQFDVSAAKSIPKRIVMSGRLDTLTDPVMHRYVADKLDAEFIDLPDEGHFAIFDHFEPTLKKLLGKP